MSWLMLPKMNYLPDVKRDAIDVWMSFTPGVNLKAQREEVIDTLIARLDPYMKGYVPITCCMGRPSASCKQRGTFTSRP